MHQFSYAIASQAGGAMAGSFIAGGTDLLALMKDGVQTPSSLIDINRLPLAEIELSDTGIRIGSLLRMSEVAKDRTIRDRYRVISEALLESASPQIRNMGTMGGNLMQRVRCGYFRDPAFPCNRRANGTGCSAILGDNRTHAILGASEHCIAVHPSDLAVALTALDAVICTRGPKGERRIPINEFYLLPEDKPDLETVLEPGELIVAIEVPASTLTSNSHYLKVRDRASGQFALVSTAVALELEKDRVKSARVAFGGVAPKPWRSREAEETLQDQPVREETFVAAAEEALKGAVPQQHNSFKIELAKRSLVRALSVVGGIS